MTNGNDDPPGDEAGAARPRAAAPPPDGSGPGVTIPEEWDPPMEEVSYPPPSQQDVAGWPRSTVVLAVLALLSVTAAAGSFAWNMTTARTPDTPPNGMESAVPGASSTLPPKPVRPPTSPKPSKSLPRIEPPPKQPLPDDPSACMHALLLPDALGNNEHDLSYVCKERRAYRGPLRLKSDIVRAAGGGKTVSDAMREWSKLGWFEMAAFAAMRAQCCPSATAMRAPRIVSGCKLEESLAYIVKALDDKRNMKKAATRFERACQCIARAGIADIFGREGSPYGGERDYFMRIATRIRARR